MTAVEQSPLNLSNELRVRIKILEQCLLLWSTSPNSPIGGVFLFFLLCVLYDLAGLGYQPFVRQPKILRRWLGDHWLVQGSDQCLNRCRIDFFAVDTVGPFLIANHELSAARLTKSTPSRLDFDLFYDSVGCKC